jgi:hypothetical protein
MLVGMPVPHSCRSAVAAVLVVLTGSLALVACDGGNGDDESSDRRTTTTTAATTTSSGPTTTSSTAPPLTPAPVDTCGANTEFITEAVEGSTTDDLMSRKDEFSVQRCRLSQSELIWAVVELVPEPGSTFAPTTALMERIGATWIVRQTGSLESCDAPERARVELGLTCAE